MNQSYAALDLGTNTTLLLVADHCNGQLLERQEEMRPTRLGEGVASTRRLSGPAIARTIEAVQQLIDGLPHGSHGCAVTVGTSAMRDALNGEDFMALFNARFGHRPYILSGSQEAECVFRGAVSDAGDDEFIVAVDIGGGSTEICAGTRENMLLAVSVDLGCVRLGETFNLYERAAPSDVQAAGDNAAAVLAPVFRQIRERLPRGKEITLVASGGTATTFAAVHLNLNSFDRRTVHGTDIGLTDVGAQAARLLELNSDERAAHPCISNLRASVLPAGLLVLKSAMEFTGAGRLRVTTRGLRYGLVSMLVTGDLQPNWKWPEKVGQTA